MVKQTPTIRQQQPINCLSAFARFAGLDLKELKALCLSWGIPAIIIAIHISDRKIAFNVLEF